MALAKRHIDSLRSILLAHFLLFMRIRACHTTRVALPLAVTATRVPLIFPSIFLLYFDTFTNVQPTVQLRPKHVFNSPSLLQDDRRIRMISSTPAFYSRSNEHPSNVSDNITKY